MINRYKQWFDSLLPHTKAFIWVSGVGMVLLVLDLIGIWCFKLS
jgi:hypothetical protein